MSYSWYNIAKDYDNNKRRWREKGGNGSTLTFPDGMYDYKNINNYIQAHTYKVDDKPIITLYFNMNIYRVVILVHKDYDLKLSQGDFASLLGFEKNILKWATNFVGNVTPNITRSVDWVFLHCDLRSRRVNDVESSVSLFPFTKSLCALSGIR